MNPRRLVILMPLIALTAAPITVAQIEKQAQTYDLTLEDCLTSTFSQNPAVQERRTEIERATGAKLVYRSRALPQLAAQATAGWREGLLYSPTGPYTLLTAQFSQPLIDVGIPPAIRRGQLEVIIAQQNFNREVTERLHEARVTFLQALYFRDRIALYDEIDKHLQANVQSEQHRREVGIGTEAALKSAKIQQLNLEFDLTSTRDAYFAAVVKLSEICGRDTGETTNGQRQLRLPKPLGVLGYEPATVNVLRETDYALQHRADLKLLRALVDAFTAEKQTVQAGYFPTISLVASALLLPQNFLVSKQTGIVKGQNTGSSETREGGALSWRVLDNGLVTGASLRLEAARQGYEIALRHLQQNIPRELATIEGALQSADAGHAALLKAAEAAEENLQLIESEVALGGATQLDFLKAQDNLLSVRSGILDATQAHEIARAELDHVTGRYLEYQILNTP